MGSGNDLPAGWEPKSPWLLACDGIVYATIMYDAFSTLGFNDALLGRVTLYFWSIFRFNHEHVVF